jgi:hypothetical protein
MPRKTKEHTVHGWIESYPDLMYESTRHSIYCTKCEVNIGCRKSTVKGHVEGPQHNGLYRSNNEDFYFDLIEFLILCNIPWVQIENPAFTSFFQKYLPLKKLPSESTLRKNYLDKFYQTRMAAILSEVANKKIWISLDETTDFLGRYVVHFLVKPLDALVSQKTYLLACKVLPVVNGETIAKFVTDCLETMWGESFENQRDNVLILCTDSVAYMLKAGRILKSVLPKMKHVTCIAHALHRVAEKIRCQYPDVDTLIANLKKVFLKSPSRVKLLKDLYPNLPLPPQPVITRWGTWLAAVTYYVKHFNEINTVLSRLRTSDAVAIKKAKQVLNKPNIKKDLDFIYENFNIIEVVLTLLQERHVSMVDALVNFDQVRMIINWSNSFPVESKLEAVMARNPDLDTIREYAEHISKGTASDETSFYKFAPLTSVEVERSFSIYKWVLDVKRNRLSLENIEKIIVCYYNFTQRKE